MATGVDSLINHQADRPAPHSQKNSNGNAKPSACTYMPIHPSIYPSIHRLFSRCAPCPAAHRTVVVGHRIRNPQEVRAVQGSWQQARHVCVWCEWQRLITAGHESNVSQSARVSNGHCDDDGDDDGRVTPSPTNSQAKHREGHETHTQRQS